MHFQIPINDAYFCDVSNAIFKPSFYAQNNRYRDRTEY